MAYDLAQELAKEALEEKLAQQKLRRTELEEIIQQAQKELKDIERNIAYLNELIRWISKGSPESTAGEPSEESYTLSQAQGVQNRSTENGSSPVRPLSFIPAYSGNDTCNDDDEEEDGYLLPATESDRSPMDMVKPQFKGQSMTDIVLSILKQEQRPMRSVEIALAVYETQSKEEFSRARNSIGAELRTGADKKGWKKAGRGRYVIDSIPLDSIPQKESKH